MDSIKGSLRPVQAWARRRERTNATGAVAGQWPCAVETSWLAACRKVKRMHDSGGLPEGIRLLDPQRPGTEAELQGLRDALERDI